MEWMQENSNQNAYLKEFGKSILITFGSGTTIHNLLTQVAGYMYMKITELKMNCCVLVIFGTRRNYPIFYQGGRNW